MIPIRRSGTTLSFHPPGRAPIALSHILGVGRNYREHAREMGASEDLPAHPMIFTKSPACAILDGDTIVIPRIATEPANQTDYEGELAVVIGKVTRDASEDQVADPDSGIILGYCAANDVSARWWQKKGSGGQFCRGKSFDTFCPLGPALVEPGVVAEAGGPQSLLVTTTLSGERVQHASTADMIFPVHALIAELSRGTTLLPGTVLLTGTPSGVGMARSPQRFLAAGDTVTVTIAAPDGSPLATLTNPAALE
jgi:2-keto-4-pentenoate hydratase/2-oxohepta-3-ene-1,7-dioic acid hydratase in catechol pathway